jgi:hypothetical protein
VRSFFTVWNPGLGHDLSPAIGYLPGSSMYGIQKSGPIEDYALVDLNSWLEAQSSLSHPYVTTAITSTLGGGAANTTSSLNTNTTPPSKR